MQILQDMVIRKEEPITKEEGDALIAIRKEYLRKNIETKALYKELRKCEKRKWDLEKENDKITDDAIKWFKDKEQMNQLYNKLKREYEYSKNRATIAEANLLKN